MYYLISVPGKSLWYLLYSKYRIIDKSYKQDSLTGGQDTELFVWTQTIGYC